MAGQDQSVNLGGMLGQIAETTGSMGNAYKPVLKAATKPRGNMDDPAHLNNLAQWASSNGDAQAASMYMQQARQLQSEQKKVADATMINGATAAYKKAREGGDAQQILDAEQALIDAANATGSDAHARLESVQSALSRAEEAAYQKGQRERAEEERVALEQFTQELNAVSNPDQIQAVVEGADPAVAPIAQKAATARLQYLEAQSQRAERDANSVREVAVDLTIPEGLPPKIAKALEAELASVNGRIERDFVNGTWATDTARSEAIKAREALADKIYRASYGQDMADYSTTQARIRDRNGKATRIAIATPSKDQAAQIRKELENASEEANEKASTKPGFLKGLEGPDDITVEDVNKEWRRQQMVSLDTEYRDVLPPSGEGTPKTREQHIEDAKDAYPNKTEKEVIKALQDQGIIE